MPGKNESPIKTEENIPTSETIKKELESLPPNQPAPEQAPSLPSSSSSSSSELEEAAERIPSPPKKKQKTTGRRARSTRPQYIPKAQLPPPGEKGQAPHINYGSDTPFALAPSKLKQVDPSKHLPPEHYQSREQNRNLSSARASLLRGRPPDADQRKRTWHCGCGKSYLTYGALYHHTRVKHGGCQPPSSTRMRQNPRKPRVSLKLSIERYWSAKTG